jgi:HEAT repeat protein
MGGETRFVDEGRTMPESRLLTDEQMQRFIAHGYLCLPSELPASFHRRLYERFDALIGIDERSNNPGNNLLPLVPELNEVFADPVVTGALISVVGRNYVMHPHRALHNNMPGSEAQNLHKDSYWGYRSRVRNHRSRWAMVMYVPQATPLQQGPTGVVPGSHYQTRRPDPALMPEVPGELQAGGFLLIHYDIWHRKMKNLTNRNRFMMKFEFARTENPASPSWDHRDARWSLGDTPGVDMSSVWLRQWRWLLGTTAEPLCAPLRAAALAEAVADLSHADPHRRLAAINAIAASPQAAREMLPGLRARLDDACDPVAIAAAYAMARAGEAAVPLLHDAILANDGPHVEERGSQDVPPDYLTNEERIACAACYGLLEVGGAAVSALFDLLACGQARARKLAVHALGEIADTDDAVTRALCAATTDAEATVRVNAVEALGWKPSTPASLAALTQALRDTAADVRFSAAFALGQLGPAAEAAVASLEVALADENRYVPGYAVEALERIASPRALRALVPFLKSARWCAHTSPASIY